MHTEEGEAHRCVCLDSRQKVETPKVHLGATSFIESVIYINIKRNGHLVPH